MKTKDKRIKIKVEINNAEKLLSGDFCLLSAI